ncbi:hypothetical protein R1flu_029066 [Riccia fluitans]|uniref:Protein kinase domain-containing protein n=1 Tax=Riccia fluitans TaxID=41844 RepID=A0ABD1XNG4_9MARC
MGSVGACNPNQPRSLDDLLSVELFRQHRLDMATTLLQGLGFMHMHGWLHCDIHPHNIFVHFPLWDWDDMGKVNVRHDNQVSDPNGRRIQWKLVFVGIGDLGWAQKVEDAKAGKFPYDVNDPNPRNWIAPKLTMLKAPMGPHGQQFITGFTRETDTFALGWVLEQLCGDFFTDMTDKSSLRAADGGSVHMPTSYGGEA